MTASTAQGHQGSPQRVCGQPSEGGTGAVSAAPHHPLLPSTPRPGEPSGWMGRGGTGGEADQPLCSARLRVRPELRVAGSFKRDEKFRFSFRPEWTGRVGRENRRHGCEDSAAALMPPPCRSCRAQWPLHLRMDVAGCPLPTGSRNQRPQLTAQPVTSREDSGGPRRPSTQHPCSLSPVICAEARGASWAPCGWAQRCVCERTGPAENRGGGAFTAAQPTDGLCPDSPVCPRPWLSC